MKEILTEKLAIKKSLAILTAPGLIVQRAIPALTFFYITKTTKKLSK